MSLVLEKLERTTNGVAPQRGTATANLRRRQQAGGAGGSTTTTTYYPYNSLPRNPSPNSIIVNRNPRYHTLIFTSTTTSTLSDRIRPPIHFDSDPAITDFDGDSQSSTKTSSDFPLNFYSSVSSSIRERTKDIMRIVGALLFGVGCGPLTAVVMYFAWALFSPQPL